MMESLKPYIEMILNERSWSWAVICLLYVLAAFFVRGWFTGPITAQIKMLDSKHRHALKKHYIKQALLGWFFFFLPIVLIFLYWRRDSFPFKLGETAAIAFSSASFILSIVLHLQAFAIASLLMVESLESQKPREI